MTTCAIYAAGCSSGCFVGRIPSCSWGVCGTAGMGGKDAKKRVLGTMPSLEAVPRARMNHMDENAPGRGAFCYKGFMQAIGACRFTTKESVVRFPARRRLAVYAKMGMSMSGKCLVWWISSGFGGVPAVPRPRHGGSPIGFILHYGGAFPQAQSWGGEGGRGEKGRRKWNSPMVCRGGYG